MNLFFYLRTFILNYSFIVILSDHIFCTLFYYNTTLYKTETCENGKNTGTITFRFRQVLLYFISLDIHGSVHRNINLIERTNKMQPCSRIYYSSVS